MSQTTLSRGQKWPIPATVGDAVEVLVELDLPGRTVDVACFGLDAQGKLSDDRYMVFYNQRRSPKGEIELPEGAGTARFRVSLGALPASISRLVFAGSIDGEGTMKELRQGRFELRAGGAVVAELRLEGAWFGGERALMVADLYRKDGWRVAAVAQGFSGGLDALLTHFGGVASDAPPPPAPAPAPPPKPAAAPPVPPLTKPAPAVPPLTKPAPAAPPLTKPAPTRLTLEKRGASKKLSLAKAPSGDGAIRVNLNWTKLVETRGFFGKSTARADLDLGCLYICTDGSGGVVQALGGTFGRRHEPPFIFLDKDDRSGAAADGENLTLARPDLLSRVLVFAFIYEGVARFPEVGAVLTIKEPDGSETIVKLDNPEAGLGFCAIALLERKGESLVVSKEELYFRGHSAADQHFGFGFRWAPGRKD